MNTRHRISILLTLTYIAVITLSMVFIGSVKAFPIVDIGLTPQANPYESNPITGSTTASMVGRVNDESYARDGKLETEVDWRIGGSATVASLTMGATASPYNGFDNSPPGGTFTIGWVDIKVKYKADPTTDDLYRIQFRVAAGALQTLQANIYGAAAQFDAGSPNYNPDERVWSKVREPTDSAWSWTDINNVRVVISTQQQGGSEDMLPDGTTPVRIWVYEVWLTVYSGTYPYPQVANVFGAINLTAPGTQDKYYDAGGTVGTWDVGEPAIRDVNDDGTYSTGDIVLAGSAPALGVTLSVPPAGNKYYDKNKNGIWDQGEPAIKDAYNTGIFDIGSINSAAPYPSQNDVVLVGMQPPGDVYIMPSKLSGLTAGSYFFIDVYVINMDHMHGFQFIIYYDPNALTAIGTVNTVHGFSYNPFILSAPSGVDDTAGWVSVAYSSWMGDPTGFTGSGPVVRIYFKVDGNALSKLTFDTAASTVSNVRGDVITIRSWNNAAYWGPQWLSAVTGPEEPLIPTIIDRAHPEGTYWHELFPAYSSISHILYWEDTGSPSGELSYSDQIYMDTPKGPLWYHVDAVTVTIHWTFKPERHTENIAVNGVFDAGETIYRDIDRSGTVTAKDALLQGPAQPIDTPLVDFGATEKHTDNVIADGLFEAGETIYQDVDNNGKVSLIIDYVLVGTEPPQRSDLLTPGSLDKYDDNIDGDGAWTVGEPAIRDVDDSGDYDSTIDVVLAMDPAYPPYDYDVLNIPEAKVKFYDADSSYDWSPDDPAIWDTNNDNVYEPADFLIEGPAQPLDTPLVVFEKPGTGAAETETPTISLPTNPINTRWHQIYPPTSFCRLFKITSWEDNGNGYFDPSDQFDFVYDATPGIIYWAHLDAVSTDIVITEKDPQPPPPPVPEFPLGLSAIVLLAPLIPIVYIWRLKKTKPKPITTQIKPKGLKP